MRVTVKLFGPVAQRAGTREVPVDLDGRATCGDVKVALGRTVPAIADLLPGGRLAVNQEFAGDDEVISPGDEIALIAMVSGG